MAGGHGVEWGNGLSACVRGVSLNDITVNGSLLLQSIAFLVRDQLWGTLPVRVVRSSVDQQADGFRASVDGIVESGAIRLRVRVDMRGARDHVTVSSSAIAEQEFTYSRIGLCSLLPSSLYAGRPVRYGSGSATSNAALPQHIGPQHFARGVPLGLFEPFSRLEVDIDGALVHFGFGGGLFEIEDQRNWSDPSFKIYSAARPGQPLLLARRAQTFAEEVTLRLDGHLPTQTHRSHVVIGNPIGRLPQIVVGSDRSPSGATPTNFAALNRSGALSTDQSNLTFGINGSVHAADNESVMATTTVHGDIARAARTLRPHASIRLAPLTFSAEPGEWRGLNGELVDHPMGSDADSRRSTDFGASWVVSSLASLGGAADVVGYFDTATLRLGQSPFALLLQQLVGLEGKPQLEAFSPPGIAALAIADGVTVRVWIANLRDRAREALLSPDTPISLAPYGVLTTRLDSQAPWSKQTDRLQ